MLMDFVYGRERHKIYLHACQPRGDGGHTDLVTVLYPGESFHGLSYRRLQRAGQGAVHIDDTTGAGVILRLGDPRLTEFGRPPGPR